MLDLEISLHEKLQRQNIGIVYYNCNEGYDPTQMMDVGETPIVL